MTRGHHLSGVQTAWFEINRLKFTLETIGILRTHCPYRSFTLLPFLRADSDTNFSGALKISDKVKKFGATVNIDSMYILSA
jgi:hypothetical protein